MQASRLGFWEMTVSKGRNERGGNQPDKNALRQKDTFIPPHIYMALKFSCDLMRPVVFQRDLRCVQVLRFISLRIP